MRIPMLSLFKKDPAKRLRKEYEKKLQEAYQAQQNSNVRQYSLLTAEAAEIKKKLDEVEAAS